MIIKPAMAAVIACGLIVPEKPALILPKPAIVRAENLEFSRNMLLGMPLTMGALAASSLGTGPYEVVFRGVRQSGDASSFTTTSIDIGPEYSDRVIFVGVYTHSVAVSTVSAGGVSGTNVTTSTYGDSIWIVKNVTGISTTVTVTGTSTYRTVVVWTLTGATGGMNPTILGQSAANNNNNNTSTTFSSCIVDDLFIAVGHKGGTGGTDAWGSLGGTSNVSSTKARIGTFGNGFGGYGSSPPVTSAGSKTVTASGFDSSKAISLSAVRIRK